MKRLKISCQKYELGSQLQCVPTTQLNVTENKEAILKGIPTKYYVYCICLF